MQTMRSGFTPYKGGERAAGRDTARVSTLDILASRKCGRTILAVVPCEGTLHKLLGRASDQTGYALIALGNAGRETRYLGRWDTLDRAEQAMTAYSPRYKLLGRG